jgi:hypothetical protein
MDTSELRKQVLSLMSKEELYDILVGLSNSIDKFMVEMSMIEARNFFFQEKVAATSDMVVAVIANNGDAFEKAMKRRQEAEVHFNDTGLGKIMTHVDELNSKVIGLLIGTVKL